MILDGKRIDDREIVAVHSPYGGNLVGEVAIATQADVVAAVELALIGRDLARQLPRHQRAAILSRAADIVASRAERFATVIVQECGKTIRQARKEVRRCENTLRLSAEACKSLSGEIIPFDSYEGATDRQGYFVRDPIGIVLAITPFNDPLNLVAHKLGPAIAAGNAVILKPSRLAPLSSHELGAALLEAGLPPPILSILTGTPDVARQLAANEHVRMISFTGGADAGVELARLAGLKKLAMDLGGSGPVIVHRDCEIASAAELCVSGAFWAAGQNCIGAQRILVHEEIYDAFASALVTRTRALQVGDPMLEETDVGPMITLREVERISSWVEEAVHGGAKVLAGHHSRGTLYDPTILDQVDAKAALCCKEAFAPVVILQKIDSLEQGISEANRGEFSLHAAIFTRDLEAALRAADALDAGGVMINDSTDFRFDGMPFGGYKRGGLGREGVRFAMEEMTQTKVVCFKRWRAGAPVADRREDPSLAPQRALEGA